MLHLLLSTHVFMFVRMYCNIAPDSIQLHIASAKEVPLDLAGISCPSLESSSCVCKSVDHTALIKSDFSLFPNEFIFYQISELIFDCTTIRLETNEQATVYDSRNKARIVNYAAVLVQCIMKLHLYI